MLESSNAETEPRLAPQPQQSLHEPTLAVLLQLQAANARRRWDAYAAVIATLVGLLALAVSAYTAYVQREQLRAQVWPSVMLATYNLAPNLALQLVNAGTGPARIVATRVTVDHEPVASWWHAQRAMGAESNGLIISQLSSTVVPAGKELAFLRPASEENAEARFQDQFLSNKHVVVVTVCYCSVLDDCWLVTTTTTPEPIGDPDNCPITTAERFKQ